jgi:hypothetical protein
MMAGDLARCLDPVLLAADVGIICDELASKGAAAASQAKPLAVLKAMRQVYRGGAYGVA